MATVPAEMTAVAGAILTAAQWNTNVRDAINFVITPPLAILRQTVAQAIANAAFTAVTFDVEEIDRDGGHSLTTNTSRYTAQTAGYYDCDAVGAFASNATGTRGVGIAVNGTLQNGRVSVTPAPSGIAFGNCMSGRIYLNVGDYAEVQVRQDSGGSLNTNSASSIACAFTLQWCSTA